MPHLAEARGKRSSSMIDRKLFRDPSLTVFSRSQDTCGKTLLPNNYW
jgi:hypothetical protein